MNIKILDNLINKEIQKNIYNEITGFKYYYGEYDKPDTPPTGLVAELPNTSLTFNILTFHLKNFLEGHHLYRSYVNLFKPNENPYFHIDREKGKTVLYYPNIDTYDLDEGGETQFYQEEIKGIRPVAGRIVIFDSNILHKATSFRNQIRYTVALKYD
jgi:hypothetical protein